MKCVNAKKNKANTALICSFTANYMKEVVTIIWYITPVKRTAITSDISGI